MLPRLRRTFRFHEAYELVIPMGMMHMPRLKTVSLAFTLLSGTMGTLLAEPIFNGKDLTGWEGNPDIWKVENGAIVGTTTSPEQLKNNEFLIWKAGKTKNFELTAKIRLTGDNNTGIQYRSHALPEVGPHVVGGYQCDIHPKAEYTAMLYEERGRGIVAQNGQSVVTDPQGAAWLVAERPAAKADVTQWTEFTIVAKGNHIVHKINGQVSAEITDFDEKSRSLEGLLALQIHKGKAMKVEVQSIDLKPLPDGPITTFEKAAVPNDAQRIESVKPSPKKPSAAPAATKGAAAPGAPATEKPQDKPNRPGRAKKADSGEQTGENRATPVERIRAAKGFQVELLYSVPGKEMGSWVNLCVDPKGRIYASDQYGGLYRFNPPAPGKTLTASDVQKVPVDIRAVNGMAFAFGALYVGVNDYDGKIPSGLYKIVDSDNDGELDKAECLRAIPAKGDHGVHAVVPTPDGKSLYLVCGNSAQPTEMPDDQPVPKTWGEDHLLPRMPDGRGFMRDVVGPGGIIYRVSPDGQKFEAVANGFRNIFDASVNADGELFTYDADMEYDFNTPWYRPTRINHVVSGGEFGWRNGAGKRPDFYPDNLGTVVDIGPGSPCGTTFGYGAKFPAKYQNALFALDWSWGKLYAIHIERKGSGYVGTKEEFLTGSPLPLTDAVIHPGDGAMYFAIGGRKVQSGLYRVTYTGSESTAPAIKKEAKPNEATALRTKLEALHHPGTADAVEAAWPHLANADRNIRWAARIAVEHQQVATWWEKALQEKDPATQVEALMALARSSGSCPQIRGASQPVKNAPIGKRVLAALAALNPAELTGFSRLSYLRTVQIALNRFGAPEPEIAAALEQKHDSLFPAKSFPENWILCETLCYLQSPKAAQKAMDLIANAPTQEEQMEYARSLRTLKTGWTADTRKAYLEWFHKAANYRGGASFDQFIAFIRNDAMSTFTPEERTAHKELIEKKVERKSPLENIGAVFAGRTPKDWKLEELSPATKDGMKGRDFANGRKMFGAAACYACHRFQNEGGMTGPDLSGAGGRYSPHDLLDQILNPSKEINEQFVPIVVTKNNGESLSGVVVNLSGDSVTLNTDAADPNQRVNIDRKEVKSIEQSPVSPMPPMLLAMLKKEEILDLLAYVLSGGDEKNAMFAK